jgi:hypothetical protein
VIRGVEVGVRASLRCDGTEADSEEARCQSQRMLAESGGDDDGGESGDGVRESA